MGAARRCESACKPKCKCRCGGLLHGKKRGDDPAFFEALPDDDPHKAMRKRERKKRVLKKDRPLPLLEGLGI
jgi:hypothetical protein